MIRASWTKHGWAMFMERSKMLQEDLFRIIDDDLVILIGQERDTNRAHKVFYSILDQMYYVVIQDIENGEIITVLPADYHNRWRISEEVYYRARRLVDDSLPERSSTRQWVGSRVTLYIICIVPNNNIRIVVDNPDFIRKLLDFEGDQAARQRLFERIFKAKINRNLGQLDLQKDVFYRFTKKEKGDTKKYPLM